MKAIALISGGLDSILAARIIQEQGIEVIPLHFKIPFCHRLKNAAFAGDKVASLVKQALSLPLRTVDIGAEFLPLLERPRHGFGSGSNPCIDCKVLMARVAAQMMAEWGASFVITGEVLGQRPMSQHRRALRVIEEESGLGDLLLRPLSARRLPETFPERQGWVLRKRLLDFCGRGRRPQMELAERFMISGYPNAAGGCLLTDKVFSRRIRDLIAHRQLSIPNTELLKAGRHFRLNSELKLVVGRDQEENAFLESLAQPEDHLFYPPEDIAGPTALARGIMDEMSIRLCCSIVCKYCDASGLPEKKIIYRKTEWQQSAALTVAAAEDSLLKGLAV